jgi:D-tyrosyl-tRNA(Tyr) deacylase
MRSLIQRVRRASVSVEGTIRSSIGSGMLILLGVRQGDTAEDARYLADRCIALRVFEDEQGKMNRSILDSGGSVLVVSQFTLYGDTRRGNRPSFTDAAPPDVAEQRYEEFVATIRQSLGEDRVGTGVFRAMMDVELVNDGPVTVIVESKER